MKRFLSVVMAVLMIITSCTVAFNVLGAWDCSLDGHAYEYAKNDTRTHRATCKYCGDNIAKEAHNIQLIAVVEPTCEKDGYTLYECVMDGVELPEDDCRYERFDDRVPALGHDIVKTIYTYNIDTNKAFIDVVCRNEGCDYRLQETTVGSTNRCPKCTKLTLTSKTVVEPTCRAQGYTEYVCSNSECGTFTRDNTQLVDHNFSSQVVPATCTTEGHIVSACSYCGFTKTSNYIPPKGHSFNKAGGIYTYTYNTVGGFSVQVIGPCADCDDVPSYGITSTDYVHEKCKKCGNGLTSKTVHVPSVCTDATVTDYVCPTCNNYSVEGYPVGHDLEKTTYTYSYDSTGKLISTDIAIECKVCEATSIADGEYKEDTVCMLKCGNKINKRVVVAPTCTDNGFVKVYCPECGEYTESVIMKKGHSPKVMEWKYDHQADVVTYGASCQNRGCDGYYSEVGKVGTSAYCDYCENIKLNSKKIVYPTCNTIGYTDVDCGYCGRRTKIDIKNPKEHNIIKHDFEATCLEGSYTVSTCKNCFVSENTPTGEALGHEGTVTTIMYDEAGNKILSGYCLRESCREEDRNYSIAYNAGEYDENEKICSKCDQPTITKKIFTAPYCASNGDTFSGYTTVTCSNLNCKTYRTDIIAGSHVCTDWVVEVKATCLQEGRKTSICKVCGYKNVQIIDAVLDSNGKPKHQFMPLEDEKLPTCTEKGWSPHMYCQTCGTHKPGEDVPAIGHLFDPESTNPNFCSRCNSYVLQGKEEVYVCDCICHNQDGLAAFFFKIVCFFYQILGISKQCCENGLHY